MIEMEERAYFDSQKTFATLWQESKKRWLVLS